MLKQALGFIETYGYIGAIEAADSCLKSANVELVNCHFVGKGLVTIIIQGDVSSVKASIDAGATAAERVGQVVSVNVIARPGEGLEKVVEDKTEVPEAEQICDGYDKQEVVEQQVTQQEEVIHDQEDLQEVGIATEAQDQPHKATEQRFVYHKGEKIPFENMEIFKTMKVVELRKIVRQINNISIKKDKIKFAKKEELLQAINKVIKEVD